MKKRTLNNLSPREWTVLSRSIWTSRELSPPRKKHQLEHGATFPLELASRLVKIYSKKGDLVLDPFLGIGTTLEACKMLERNGIGFEIYERFIKIAKRNIIDQKSLIENETIQKIINDDCRNLLNEIKPSSVQLVLTSPPYANFIHRSLEKRKKRKMDIIFLKNNSVIKKYGDDRRDFGNMNYQKFLYEIKKLMEKLFIITKKGGYNVWIVKDYRDPQNGYPIIPVHNDFIRLGIQSGFTYHDLIIWDQNDARKLIILGYPSVFYVNINHTFIIVMRKTRDEKNGKNKRN